MRALRELAGPRRFLLVGDSKLVSYANLRDLLAAEVDFVAPASKTYVTAEVLAALDVRAATPVGYVAERDQGKPPQQRGSDRVASSALAAPAPAGRVPVGSGAARELISPSVGGGAWSSSAPTWRGTRRPTGARSVVWGRPES